MHKLWGCIIRDVSQDQRVIEEHLVVVDEGRPSQLNAEKTTTTRMSRDVGMIQQVALICVNCISFFQVYVYYITTRTRLIVLTQYG